MLIVTEAQVIDVSLLHHSEVMKPVQARGGTAYCRPFIMAVDTSQFHGLTIDAQNTSIGFDFSESDFLMPAMTHLAVFYQADR